MEENYNKIISFLEEKLAEDVKMYNIAGKSSLCDIVIIATARNNRHLSSLSRDLSKIVKDLNFEILSLIGKPESEWILIDLDNLIIHLFTSSAREHYDIERLLK